MASDDGAVVKKRGHAVDEPDGESWAEGKLSGVMGEGTESGTSEDSDASMAVHATFLL